MSTSRFVFLSAVMVLLCAVSLSQGMRIGPKRCCFQYAERQVPFKQVMEYSMTSQQCPKEAVLFKTARGRYVCARPSDPWVQEYMQAIDSKRVGNQGTL
ncbi:chemokine (C-C motif) ligand 35, duplicate 1 precursor [Danio rerio]|uniref:Chemokine (C-C motif) ligand 35, duplicate 1 precursor n=1 Tax=Danio rerio TaxID=7955 RepID=A9ZPD7_DANRE|nr:chemokine (C-C motif) ligand 35, duplicate 1 precursor [Danio rerio]BAF98245.1 chemokine CCL-C25y [Danio rerio]|eukprot:NP_001108528.1 chemokine CCL-C25y precursor [Danio rerio]